MCPLYDPVEGLSLAMAGNGDPYAVLTPRLLRVLRDLGMGLPLVEVADRAVTSVEALRAELGPLVAASLVSERGAGYRPEFCILGRAEVAQADRHAATVGARLAGYLLDRWESLAGVYRELAIGEAWPFADLAFFLVGDRILDVGLLDALAEQRALMPAAPARPSPASPQARYYLWMIAGAPEQLGRYGQRTTALPWPGWDLLTFGEYHAAGDLIVARGALEARVRALSATDAAADPSALAALVGLPLLGHADTARWSRLAATQCRGLVAIYEAEDASLRRLYGTFAAGRAAPERFGEFFCWYDHLAYAHAIDALAAAGVLGIPSDRFAAAFWQEGSAAGAF